MAKIPWHFFKIPWQFPDLEKILFFPDFSLTRGNPVHTNFRTVYTEWKRRWRLVRFWCPSLRSIHTEWLRHRKQHHRAALNQFLNGTKMVTLTVRVNEPWVHRILTIVTGANDAYRTQLPAGSKEQTHIKRKYTHRNIEGLKPCSHVTPALAFSRMVSVTTSGGLHA